MKLFYRKSGQGQPLIILHGLFGQSDNWNTLAKQFAEQNFEVYIVDLRNHGLSPHSDVWNYQVMSDDILELINDANLQNVILLGHSMGGKVAMQFAVNHPELLDKLIIVDISPKYYPPHNLEVLKALNEVDFNVVKNRKEVESVLSKYITDFGTKQFLLKNIYWTTDANRVPPKALAVAQASADEGTQLAWRFNLKVITEQIENIGKKTPNNITCNTPTLFIRGEKSNYILDEDLDLIQDIFPLSILETIADAGHWVHAEKPKEFFESVLRFL